MSGEKKWFSLTGIHYKTGLPVEVSIENGLIARISPVMVKKNQDLPFVGPGLSDMQVNGFMGVDFNRPGLSDADIENLVQALWAQGVTSFLPTIITNDHDRMRTALGAIHKACSRSEIVRQAVAVSIWKDPLFRWRKAPWALTRLNM